MAGEKFDSKSFNPQAFGAYTERIPNLKRNELIKSKALKGNQDIKRTFNSQTGTVYAVLPMHGLIGGTAQNYYNHICHYITEADYEAAKQYVSNPADYDFKKILNW